MKTAAPTTLRYAVVGNPNSGKTTLFNRLCGLRAKTANFPGTTVETRVGVVDRDALHLTLVDLPGHYGLNLDRPESKLCRDYLHGRVGSTSPPDAVLIVTDAANLSRHLVFASQALQQGLPAVIALNMIDVTRRRGMTIDLEALATRSGCPIVPVSARTGEGIEDLVEALQLPRRSSAALPDPTNVELAAEWAHRVAAETVNGPERWRDTRTDRLDAVFTHRVAGPAIFAAVMAGLFYSIFSLASVPMDLIELIFASLGEGLGAVLPAGAIRDLVVNGVVAGIAGTVVFLPQICLLFFLISLLEDTGYLARAAFVMDRLLRRFGLPGQSFVPLLSAHACAMPAIMSTRLIADRRDRIATILVAPFMSCSARLPVYVLLIGMLFGDRPLLAGLAFAGCYLLGATAAMLSALIARRTILPGQSPPMVLELPDYKLPDLRTALLTTVDRALVFLRKAGTVIVAICVVLWWLGEYPHVEPPAAATALRAQAAVETQPEVATDLTSAADAIETRYAKERSFMGRLARVAEPVFAPLGYDWQITTGVLSSFIAREVFVSTMSVVLSGSDTDDGTIRARFAEATRADGSPLFTLRLAASLLVFYVLAMQCLPTLAVTHRETGSWKWPALQLVWMSSMAWLAALLVFHGLGWAGVA